MIADIFTAIAADARLASVESLIGAEHLDEHAAPPRMVWVPTVDPFIRGQGRRATSAKEPRSILTRNANVRLRLWAKSESGTDVDDIRACEELLNLVLVVIHDHAFGSYTVGTADWMETRSEHLQLGRAVDVSVTFEIPITREARPTATITDGTSADMTGTLRTPSSDITDSPSP